MMSPNAFMGFARDFNSRLSLGAKLNANLMLVGFFCAFITAILVGGTVYERFKDIEKNEISSHIARTDAMLKSMKTDVQTKSFDWGTWDATYNYLENQYQGYVAENINYSSLKNLDVNAIAFVRFDGVFSRAIYFDFNSKNQNPNEKLQTQFLMFARSPIVAQKLEGKRSYQSFVHIGDKILTISVTKVLKNEGTGIPQGFIIFGKEISRADIYEALDVRGNYAFVKMQDPVDVKIDYDTITVAKNIIGVDDQSIGSIQFTVPRTLMMSGRSLIAMILIGVCLMILIMTIVLNTRLKRIVINPIKKFQAHVATIKSTGELAQFSDNGRADEIGTLYTEFNEMAHELSVLRAKIEAQSFKIGKDESTIGIMHNIRNGLSPVSVILSKLDREFSSTTSANVFRAVQELGQNDQTDERRAKLVAFIMAAIEDFDQRLASERGKIKQAGRSLNSVLETIQSEGSSRTNDGFSNPISDLSAIINTSSAVARYAHGAKISINFECAEQYLVKGNRVLLTQVFDNIMTNATEAIEATGRDFGQIEITIEPIFFRDTDCVQISIIDDGDGFAPDMGAKIFERGFSTRDHKPGGLGLHWCANTINAMGGVFLLESTGIAKGATAKIIVQIAHDEDFSAVSEPNIGAVAA